MLFLTGIQKKMFVLSFYLCKPSESDQAAKPSSESLTSLDVHLVLIFLYKWHLLLYKADTPKQRERSVSTFLAVHLNVNFKSSDKADVDDHYIF